MKFNLLIIGVMVLQGGFLLAYLNRGINDYHRELQYDGPYGRFSSDVLQATISWIVILLLIILLPFVLSRILIFKEATKKRIKLLFISILTVEFAFAVSTLFIYGGANPEWAFTHWIFIGFLYGLPIAGLSLVSTALMSWKFYKPSQLVKSL